MRLVRSENGSILVEFAFVLPLLVLMLAYMVDYALWIQKAMQLQDAASAAAAYGAIPGNATNSTAMTQLANYIVTGSATGAAWLTVNATNFYSCSPGGSQVTATTSCPTGAPYHYVQVTVSASPTSQLGYRIIPSSLALSGSATYRVEVTP
jgi:Flp pilus assembly protein TadG